MASAIADYRHVEPSLAKYIGKSADFDDLLRLLKSSVLFAAEPLVKELTNLIACHWLIPEKVIQIWLLAKELGLPTLRDLAKATCIDRFRDLPDSSLLELSGDQFIDLAGNVHVRISQEALLGLVERWVERNIPRGSPNTFESRYPFTLTNCIPYEDFKFKYEQQQCKNNIQCVVGYKQTEDNEEKACVYGWDGTTFSEIVEIPSFSTTFTNSPVGMRALGRGFDIYLIGGEYGEDTGNFRKEIWRYSMISKTWYYVTSLPKSRRHMAAAFMKEQLFLIGGQKRNRSAHSSVNIYNIYTGKWLKGPSVKEQFTNKMQLEVDNDCLVFCNDSDMWVLDPREYLWMNYTDGYWGIVSMNEAEMTPFGENISSIFQMVYDKNRYIVDDESPAKIWVVVNFQELDCKVVGSCLTSFDNLINNGPRLIGFSYSNGAIFVEMITITSFDTMETEIVYVENRNDVRDLCSEDPIGCFNISNPNSLNELFVLNNEGKQQSLVA